MDIGTGIVIGCVILGGVATMFRIFGDSLRKNKGNPNSKYLLIETFNEYKEGVNAQLATLTKYTSELKDSLKRVHSRIDDILKGR